MLYTNLSPLEQFSVYSIFSGVFKVNMDINIFSITNIAIFILISFIFTLIFQISASAFFIKPTRWNIFYSALYSSIIGMIIDQIGPKKGLIFFPFIFTLFSFIFASNILGMIPYSFTPTSHISVTLGFSLAIMISITLIGLEKHQLDFFSLFIPSGTPLALVPLLVFIEFLSYSARAFSLALRLTANVSAGHCLFGVISMLIISAVLAMSNHFLIQGLILTLPLLVLIPLYGLELLVALLQAYVFTLLTCSYFSDCLK